MLFRQRMSFQGASYLRRRACDEMAAHKAPTYAHREGQSIQDVQLNLTVQHCKAYPARPLASSPSRTSSRPVDCRWKRGRPVIFSGRAFSTTHADLSTHGCAVVKRSHVSNIAEQAYEKRVTVAPFHQLSQHSVSCGTRAACGEHDMDGDGQDLQSCHLPLVQSDDANNSASPEGSLANVDLARSTDTRGDDRDSQSSMSSSVELDVQLTTLPRDNASDGVTDSEYTPSSSDESSSQSEKDDSEAQDDAQKQPTEIHTPLDFQIPEDVLRAAMSAPENTKASFWSSNLYRGPGDRKILVHYCRTKEMAERVAQHFVGEKVLGFDIEWKPWAHPLSIKKNVSLIQLACENRIALFHIALFAEQTAAQLMPPTLKVILESPEVYKVGVAVKGDFSRIIKFLDVEPQGVFELSRLHNLVEFSATDPSKVTNKLVGLAAQVEKHLQLPLYKGGELADDPDDTYNVRSSDWSLPLNHQQIHYAAADAYAGFRLYDALEEKRKQLNPTPLRPSVCDYDSKPKPRSSSSKSRKKRTVATKIDRATTSVDEGASTLAGSVEEHGERSEVESKQSQDTEGYETAQEDLLDSHQLEGEDLVPSEQGYESSNESVSDISIDSTPSMESEESAALTAPRERRVGRVNLSWLRGSDPGYPILPKLPIRNGSDASSNEDLVDMSETSSEDQPDQMFRAAEIAEVDQETDEFDDSELEEALQNLDIDSSGFLKSFTMDDATNRPILRGAQSSEKSISMETGIRGDNHGERPASNLVIDISSPDFEEEQEKKEEEEEEQYLLSLLKDPDVVEYLHSPTQPQPSSDPATSPHTPEYDLATSWAQSYLASTIPSPTSRAPSHIRATIPHLRAYNLWHQQGLSLREVAQHLRDPPLAESTAAGYVLQAITLERMECDEEKVRGVLMGMPEALRRGKWRKLAEKVGAK